ncbi:hypothetical protein DPH67_00915 [Limosilactobacillus reuteri]|nr:hypothetical protein DPH67_00915 [Limosilactobacillus reuteri]
MLLSFMQILRNNREDSTMTSFFSFISNIWSYIINHKWSKDILRANILFILLVIIYDLFHFSLNVVCKIKLEKIKSHL